MSKVERHLYRIGALHCVAESCFGCRRVSSPLRNKHHVGLKRNALELMLLLLLVLCKLRQRNYIRYTHKRTHETNEYVHRYPYKHSTTHYDIAEALPIYWIFSFVRNKCAFALGKTLHCMHVYCNTAYVQIWTLDGERDDVDGSGSGVYKQREKEQTARKIRIKRCSVLFGTDTRIQAHDRRLKAPQSQQQTDRSKKTHAHRLVMS